MGCHFRKTSRSSEKMHRALTSGPGHLQVTAGTVLSQDSVLSKLHTVLLSPKLPRSPAPSGGDTGKILSDILSGFGTVTPMTYVTALKRELNGEQVPISE